MMYNDALEKFNRYDKRVFLTQILFDLSQKKTLNYQRWLRIERFWLWEYLKTKIYKRIEVFKIVK